MNVKVFFIKPNGRTRVGLRRYPKYTRVTPCTDRKSYCNAIVPLETVAHEVTSINYGSRERAEAAHTGWPTVCAHCGSPFQDDDEWQVFTQSEYADDSGNVYTLRELPVGACYDADWMHDSREWCGPDGRSLHVMTPGGLWCIDSQANNCTMPQDRIHRCWVRHGKPEDGTLHVDKNGYTCGAGAGSIVCGNYHGFLHHGHLTECPA